MALIVPEGDWSLRLVTPPTSEPITLLQAKKHLRVDDSLDDDDDTITILIAAARGYIEKGWDVKIMPQTWEMTLSQFPRSDRIRFPIGPIQAIPYFEYDNTAAQTFTLTVGAPKSGSQLLTRLSRKPAEVVLPFGAVWPATILNTADPIRIGLNCGFLTGGSPETAPLPPQLLMALYLLIGHWYENRSAVTVGTLMKSDPLALAVSALLATLGFDRYN